MSRRMHDLVFYIAMIWMTGLFCICVVMIVRSRSGLVRVLALDTLTLVLVALLVLYSTTTKTSYFLDSAIVLALISFISVIAAARYHAERRLF
jgi:multicomponent Na+:H+ antiporter subunit F